jgi:Flagellar P-ring protein
VFSPRLFLYNPTLDPILQLLGAEDSMTHLTPRSTRIAGAIALTVAFAIAGCESDSEPRAGKTPIASQDIVTVPVYPALRGTIGEYAVFVDSAPLPVEGWGIVGNLPGTGSGDMSPEVRNVLTDRLYREGAGSYVRGTQNLNPERILASNQIAAVEVHGIIPPLARPGDNFDLTVKALPDTQTTSLSGGLLWTSDLKLIGLRTDIDSKTIAQGRGPVFIPGAVAQVSTTQPALSTRAQRSGVIIGGGVCTEPRLIRFQLLSPSYRIGGAIERAINSRFPAREKIASVESESIIALNIPDEFTNEPAEFIDIVKHMFIAQSLPGFTEQKAAELITALSDPHAPLPEISRALQALGRSIVPDYLEPQYTSTNPTVRFWAGRAGAALNDIGGMVVLEEFANEEGSPFREQAVKSIVVISNAGDTIRATLSLMRLVNSNDAADRISGYTGLVRVGSPVIRTYNVSNKFFLDVVPSSGPPLIYATQTGRPRIALIGHDLHLPKDAFYVSPDNLLTLNVTDPDAAPADSSATQPAVDATPADPNVVTASALTTSSADPLEATTQPATVTSIPAQKQNVILYYRTPFGDHTINMKTKDGLIDVIIHLAWAPDPTVPGFNPNATYIGASYQRIVEMLASMCHDQLIESQFVLQQAAAPVNPNDSLGGRPEGSTHTHASILTEHAPAAAPAPPAK